MKYGKFDVYIDDDVVGELDISGNGLLTSFLCRANFKSSEVMRLAADIGDGYEKIGVMMPDGESYCLNKQLTKNDIYLKNLDRAEKYVIIGENAQYKSGGKESLSEEEEADPRLWTICEDPAELFNDREAGEAVARCSDVLKAEYDGAIYVAVPVKSDEPLPSLPIFYFGQRGTLNGCEYILFTLKNGVLQI